MSEKGKTIQQVHSELSSAFDTYWLVAEKNRDISIAGNGTCYYKDIIKALFITVKQLFQREGKSLSKAEFVIEVMKTLDIDENEYRNMQKVLNEFLP